MELNPFYQSDDDYEDERLDISNGHGNVENHDYEDEQLDISNGNGRVAADGKKQLEELLIRASFKNNMKRLS